MVRSLLFTLLAAFSIQSAQAKNYYEPSHLPQCLNPSFENERQIDPRFAPPGPRDQKNTDTCFGYAATYLIQYLLNTSLPKRFHASILHMILQGCNHSIPMWGGQSYDLLHNLKGAHVPEASGLDIQKVTEFESKYKLKNLDDPGTQDACIADMREMFPKQSIDFLRSILPELSQVQKADPGRLTSKMIEKNTVEMKTQIPEYDVHVFEMTKPYTYQNPEPEAKTRVLTEIKNALLPMPPKNISFPIIFNFCPEDGPNGCYGLHSVVVTGVRTLCCDHPHTFQRFCTDEYEIKNSYNGIHEGWHNADPLNESFLKYSQKLTRITPCEVNDCSPMILGPNPISYLASSGDLDQLKHKIEKLPNFDIQKPDARGLTLLHYAVFRKYNTGVLEYLLNKGIDINAPTTNGQDSPLHIAAEFSDAKTIRFLIEKKARIYAANAAGLLPIHSAAKNGNTEAVLEFIKNNVPYGTLDAHRNTPLIYASRSGKLETVQTLMELQNPKQREEQANLALLEAIPGGHMDVINYLLTQTGNINILDRQGKPILNLAVESGHSKIVDALLKKNPGPNLSKDDYIKALYSASVSPDPLMFSTLIQNGFKVPLAQNGPKGPITYIVELLQNAFSYRNSKNIEILTHLLPPNTPIDPVLFLAVKGNNKDMVKFLLQRRAKPDIQDTTGQTPLGHSIDNGYADVAEELIHAGANISGRIPNFQISAIMLAVRKFSTDILSKIYQIQNANFNEYLNRIPIDHKNDLLNLQDFEGRTILHHLIFSKNHNAVRNWIQSHSVNLNLQDVYGFTPLHFAVILGDLEMVRILLQHKSRQDLEKVTKDGRTAFLIAVSDGNLAITKLLAENGANFHAIHQGGRPLNAIEIADITHRNDLLPYLRSLLHPPAPPGPEPKAGQKRLPNK